MSCIIKALLLLVVLVCLSAAQRHELGKRCICSSYRQRVFGRMSDLVDIQIYPASIFCDKLEIVITSKDRVQYCLDPSNIRVKRLLERIINKGRAATTARPTVPTSTPSSIDSAEM
ncbi:C-X-C motif chemokine 2-like [Genypterus blacodes]|uniref:C-X-C motif chemokine 2-like n=1 Tax=Genypterus blacodes TaxID=154954 RepID=UPI003F76BB6C